MEKYEGCPVGVNYIRQKYPNGVEAIVLINDPNIELEYLHFGRKYLDVSPEEFEAYRKRCEIDEYSRFIWDSDHIVHSEKVSNSSNVNGSKNIEDSKDIDDSVHIYTSSNISHSIDVGNCEDVRDGTKILYSKHIAASSNIIECENVEWSDVLLYTSRAKDSKYLYMCEDVEDCYFGGFLKNCKHCLFCSGLEGKEYYIFNESVNPQDFDGWREELNFRLLSEDNDVITTFPHKLDIVTHFSFSRRLDTIFSKLSSNFYGWVGTIPHYSDEKFLVLFFHQNEEDKN